jgi:hypothetical protein
MDPSEPTGENRPHQEIIDTVLDLWRTSLPPRIRFSFAIVLIVGLVYGIATLVR